ncbi:MAG: response regulator [Pseudobdellovibrionaceae bacterium]
MKSKTFRRVLVVEDDSALLEELKTLFESEFETVVTASDGGEAYIRSLSEDFDIIFSDIKMPGMSGIDLIVRLRSEGKHTPVILSSSAADREHLVQAIRLGVLDFVEKPYTPEMLREALYRNLEILRREKRLTSYEHGATANPAAANQQKRMIGLLQATHSSFKKALS